MNIIKEADYRKALKGTPATGYLFFGDEDYMKVAAMRQTRAALGLGDGAEAFFNDIRLDGLDFTPSALLDAMTVPPLGAERKLITVTGLNFNTMKAADQDALCEVLEALSDYPYVLLIISVAAEAIDEGLLPKRPSEVLTELGQYLTLVYFERNTPAKLAGWVQKHYLHHGVQASPELCQLTVNYCGRNMFVLAGEIDKVSFYVRAHGRDTVTEADLRTAAIPAVEYDAFAFTNAIMERRRGDALDILADLKFRRVEPLFILSEVSRVICDLVAVRTLSDSGRTVGEISSALKMHEYRVGLYMRQARGVDVSLLRDAVAACREADRALKLSSVNPYSVIEKLITTL